jgi:hypothetical protein
MGVFRGVRADFEGGISSISNGISLMRFSAILLGWPRTHFKGNDGARLGVPVGIVGVGTS